MKRELFCTSSTDVDVLVIFNFPGVLEKNSMGPIFTETVLTASHFKASTSTTFYHSLAKNMFKGQDVTGKTLFLSCTAAASFWQSLSTDKMPKGQAESPSGDPAMTKFSFSSALLMWLKIGRRLPFKGKKIRRSRVFRNQACTQHPRLQESE